MLVKNNLDKPLLTYIQKGWFVSGVCKKQVKRIERAAKHYLMDGENRLYRKNLSENKFKVVPPVSQRESIIKEYHARGHFGIEANLKRIQEKYFWHYMPEDIKLHLRQCEVLPNSLGNPNL